MSSDPDASKQASIIAGDVILMCLSLTAVLLRLIARRMSAAKLWYDDYLIMVALVLAYGPSICNLVAVHFGFGLHESAARPDAASKWYELLYIFEEFYSPAIATIKLSILLFYARIFPNKNFRKQLYAVGAVVIMWWISCQFTTIFECTPIDYFWTADSGVDGRCIAIQKYFLGQAIPSIITDLVILIIPLPPIWHLNLPTTQRIALSGVFLLGSFVTFTSIYRLVLLTRLTQVDITWNYAEAAIWTVTSIVGTNLDETNPRHSALSTEGPILLWSQGVRLMGRQDEELLTPQAKNEIEREDYGLYGATSNTENSESHVPSTPSPFGKKQWYGKTRPPVELSSISVKQEFGVSNATEQVAKQERSSLPAEKMWYNKRGETIELTGMQLARPYSTVDETV
ncbi:hypothetical protein MMC13_005310 [Lambiella insularis]|nr:hypothetical protein [Lambiella insularis]